MQSILRKFYREHERDIFVAISVIGGAWIMYNRYKIYHAPQRRKLRFGEASFPSPPFTKQEQLYALQALEGIRNRMYRPNYLPAINSPNKSVICAEIAHAYGHGQDFKSFCEIYYDRMLSVIHEVQTPIDAKEIEANRKLIREQVLKARAQQPTK
jgi:hypothetical protein